MINIKIIKMGNSKRRKKITGIREYTHSFVDITTFKDKFQCTGISIGKKLKTYPAV